MSAAPGRPQASAHGRTQDDGTPVKRRGWTTWLAVQDGEPPPLPVRLLWMLGIWLASVLSLGVVALLLRWVLD
ncbi:MAG: DUF2474 domain-containing protein [Hydrogenophaga sp.]|jgi:hypothetical protein|nr:DUF2474 domain-containing protein [Hydrogenophaga sp.]